MSNFAFLMTQCKDIHEVASKAESAAIPATALAVEDFQFLGCFLPDDAELARLFLSEKQVSFSDEIKGEKWMKT